MTRSGEWYAGCSGPRMHNKAGLGRVVALAVFSALLVAATSSGCASSQCEQGQSVCNADGTISGCFGSPACDDGTPGCSWSWRASSCELATSTSGLTCAQLAPDQAVCVPPGTTLVCSTTSLPPDSFVDSAVTGDFDGDGDVDVVQFGGNGTPNNLETALGDGTGNFRAGPSQMAPPGNWGVVSALVAGDFDGDGHLDIAGDRSAPPGVLVWLGDGDGGFASPAFEPTAASARVEGPTGGFAAGDVNHDGRTDLVTGTLLLVANADGGFDAQSLTLPIVCATPDGPMVLQDFDGDGWIDLAFPSGSDLCVLFNDGSGHLTQLVVAATGAPSATGALAIAAGDLNGDGLTDIALLEQTSLEAGSSITIGITVVAGRANRTFATPAQLQTLPLSGPIGMAVADVSGDGLPDIVVGGGEALGVMLGQKGALPLAATFAAPAGTALQLLALANFADAHRADALVLLSAGSTGSPALLDVANACAGAGR